MCRLEWQMVSELVALPTSAGEGLKGSPASGRVFHWLSKETSEWELSNLCSPLAITALSQWCALQAGVDLGTARFAWWCTDSVGQPQSPSGGSKQNVCILKHAMRVLARWHPRAKVRDGSLLEGLASALIQQRGWVGASAERTLLLCFHLSYEAVRVFPKIWPAPCFKRSGLNVTEEFGPWGLLPFVAFVANGSILLCTSICKK